MSYARRAKRIYLTWAGVFLCCLMASFYLGHMPVTGPQGTPILVEEARHPAAPPAEVPKSKSPSKPAPKAEKSLPSAVLFHRWR
jgi:hypothetical protein